MIKSFKTNSKKLLLLLPLILGITSLLFSYKKDVVIFPAMSIGSYSDQGKDKGNSELHYLDTTNQKLKYEFTLKEGYSYPYLGIAFSPSGGYVNLEDYDFIEVELEARHSKRIPIHILVHVPGISTPEDPISFRQMELELNYDKNLKVYRLDKNNFKTPQWWFSTWKVTENEVGDPDYSKVASFSIQNCQFLKTGIKETITVYNMKAGKNNWILVSVTFSILALFYLSVFLFIKYKTTIQLSPSYKKLEVGNYADEEVKRIINFIAENYHLHNLSSELLQKELGMSESKISSLFKTSLNTTLKKYINSIRLEEGKRLLLETDRQVSDISYKIGYTNVTHFNRVFKEAEACSPNEYRKRNLKSIL